MSTTLRIATRRSPLALWQANHVATLLERTHLGLTTELVPLKTRGDQILDRSLSKIGGKGLFIKELEHAMLEDRADIAVHSMKDMPVEVTAGLTIAAVLPRASPLDAFVSTQFDTPADLPKGARVGTSSLRRSSQLLTVRPDFEILPLRGNVETRLGKLDDGECHAVILAAAGLERLGLGDRITMRLPADMCLPAIGQGIIGIECRERDQFALDTVRAVNDEASWEAIRAERALGAALGGDCQTPIAGHALPDGDGWVLHARVLSPDGQRVVAGSEQFSAAEGELAGRRLGARLLGEGAQQILADITASA